MDCNYKKQLQLTFHLSHKQVVQPHLSQKQVDLKSDQTSTQQTFRVGGSVK